MVILGYIYRFASNFAFLALVYLTLNFLSKYSERSIIAFLVLVYSSMRIVSTIRQFMFFQKIERLENDAKAGSTEGSTRRRMVIPGWGTLGGRVLMYPRPRLPDSSRMALPLVSSHSWSAVGNLTGVVPS